MMEAENTVGRQNLKPWHLMLRRGQLEEITLTPGSFLSNQEIKDKWNHEYHPDSMKFKTVENSTLFWYPPGVYKEYPHQLYGGEQREIAGVFLRGVIPKHVQDLAFSGLNAMKWHGPRREETKTALNIQRDNIAPKELTIGMVRPLHVAEVMPSKDTIRNEEPLRNLIPLWEHVASCFARVLPDYFRMHNSPRAHAGPQPDLGGIPSWLRRWFLPGNNTTPFSTVTLLRSCPASIHKDRNANKWQHNFACLTSLGSDFKGGRFCLIEYGIKVPITPGDLFIGQTTREWHYNLDPVVGTKYSMICYYHPRLKSDRLKHRTYNNVGEVKESKEEH